MPEYRPWVSKLLNHGQTTMVSELYAYLLDRSWYAFFDSHVGSYYVICNVAGSPRTSERLHRAIMAAKLGRPLLFSEKVDHINHDTTDNRDENLRLATNAENATNRVGPNKNNTSGYRGVVWDRNKWVASTLINGKRVSIGRFSCRHKAGQAFIEFAAKNMPGFNG